MIDKMEKAQAEIDTLRQCAGLIIALKPVLNAFDGKLFNCRLQKAIQAEIDAKMGMREIDGRQYSKYHVYCEKTAYDKLYIYVYINGKQITLALSDLDGKRIDSKKLTASANEKRAELLKNAAEIENDLTHIDEYVQQVEYIKQLFDKMEKSLNWRTRDIFNLNYHIRNY